MSVAARIERVTFAGGEAGENLLARADMAIYQIAVEKMENYVSMKEGGAMRSPGTRLVLELKDESQQGRLLPFRYSPTDYYMLVINGGVSRLVREGGFVQNEDTTPFEFNVPWAEADLASLRSARSGNTLFVASNKRTQELTRTGLLNWTCADYMPKNGPVDTQNIDPAKTVQASAATGLGITLTGAGNVFDASQAGGIFRIDDRDLSATPEWSAIETAIPQDAQRRWNGNVYRATLATADAGPNAPVHTEGSVSAGKKDATTPYQTWEFLHPGYGFVRIKVVANANSATADVVSRLPDTVVSGATLRWYPPAWTDAKGWPSSVAFRTPRLLFGRGPYLWGSANDDPHDHDLGKADDDDAIAAQIRAPDDSLVDIQWMLPAGVLILGTSDLEWMFRVPDFYGSLTPKAAGAFDCGSDGSVAAEPVKVDGGIMWIGKTAKRIHYAPAIDAQSQNFDAEEISVRASHIFASGIARMAWQKDPNRVMWIALKDGRLASLTFMQKQQVCAFARQPRLNFFIEDIAVIPGVASGVDEVYMIVRRTINGQTRRFVEQLANFFTPLDPDNPTAEGAWFLDCALNLVSDVPITQVTQLAHLEGETVGVFADGAMQENKVVVAGTIDLDRPSKNILVGLPIRGYIRDLPRNFNTPAGPTTGAQKSCHDALVRFKHSGGGKLRVYNPEEDNPDLWESLIETGTDDYGTAPPLITGQIRAQVEGDLAMEAQLELVNDDAMPCTVLAMSPKIDVLEDG